MLRLLTKLLGLYTVVYAQPLTGANANPVNWNVNPGRLMTRWSQNVTAENAWQEYSRPGLVRNDAGRQKSWMNLNGLWEFDMTASNLDNPPFDVLKPLPQKILVPFPVESALSGIRNLSVIGIGEESRFQTT
eukprot:CAMPEP_0204839580 /NCGR_PEP_ID=MMETSP1346-20131115/34745_1 /ASSEMBLY_ACC=CAM_ASM_000771 /TAXON_ID=215587 /ORGANISM="Aplanochytrium stocchinoi, Strain GSBS06" /LENGTH=131 /DNA_ID=CAMNT_0051976421 /DNA_START=57 /DNA_END=452 /DNA_ORIENTATION=+